MARWNSLQQMVTELGLKADPSNREAVRSAVRAEIAAIHPDHQGGKFASLLDEDRFHILREALKDCDTLGSTALVPIQDIPALVAAVRDALAPAFQASAVQQRADYREAVHAEIHRGIMLPRIGSTVFGAVCGALLAFGKNFKDDPLFGPLLENGVVRYTLLIMLFYSGLLFILTWLGERRQAARAEWLSTARGRRFILARVLEARMNSYSNEFSFSFSDVVDAIREPSRRQPLFLLFSGNLSPTAAERLAQMHLDELERQGVLRKSSVRRIDVTYEIEHDAARDLMLNR